MMRERMQDLNEYDPTRYLTGGGTSGGMSPFLMGALAGAAVALLFAPQPGRDSRHWIADKARSLRKHGEDALDDAQEFGSEMARNREEKRGPYGEGINRPGMQGQGTTGTPGGPKGPTSTNPVPTSPTGTARV